jgi:thiol-disulfide isomerase/thioredoxin
MRGRLLLSLTAVGALALAGCSTGTNAASGTATGQNRYVQGDGKTVVFTPAQRKAVPAVAGQTLEGGQFDLASVRGHVVVINFFASWCNPCRLESQALADTYQATRASGVSFLGIDIRDNRDLGKAFVAGRSPYPSLFDPTGRIALGFTDVPPQTIPATLIVDRDGRIAAVIRDSVRQDSLTKLVNQIVAGQP